VRLSHTHARCHALAQRTSSRTRWHAPLHAHARGLSGRDTRHRKTYGRNACSLSCLSGSDAAVSVACIATVSVERALATSANASSASLSSIFVVRVATQPHNVVITALLDGDVKRHKGVLYARRSVYRHRIFQRRCADASLSPVLISIFKTNSKAQRA